MFNESSTVGELRDYIRLVLAIPKFQLFNNDHELSCGNETPLGTFKTSSYFYVQIE